MEFPWELHTNTTKETLDASNMVYSVMWCVCNSIIVHHTPVVLIKLRPSRNKTLYSDMPPRRYPQCRWGCRRISPNAPRMLVAKDSRLLKTHSGPLRVALVGKYISYRGWVRALWRTSKIHQIRVGDWMGIGGAVEH